MKELVQGTLYLDAQQERRTSSCPKCGAVCYWPGYHCIRCGREKP